MDLSALTTVFSDQRPDTRRIEAPQRKLINRFRRGESYRFCLSPYVVARDPEHGTRS